MNLNAQETERHVSEDAFLVSKTDTRGIITYCNLPFIEIAGAKKNGSDLLGRPHNVVRHPEMPKIIFKLLWEYIKDKREIFAYVKNKSFDGSFYWVYANITASVDTQGNIIGYYSVRRKPNPKAIEVIKPIYSRLLMAERSGGVENARKELAQILKEKNVSSYDELLNTLQRI